MSQRFFVESPIEGVTARLVDTEAHHLIHVMRANPGDEVTLFDGCGAEFPARVAKLGRSHVDLDIVARREICRELSFELTLGVALPRGDRQKWLVEKATELGVTRLVPLVTERGVAEPGRGTIDKLRRAVVESSKQCGRNRLMEIVPACSWNDYLATPTAESIRIVAHPLAEDLPKKFAQSVRSLQVSRFIAIGAEGGFSDNEIDTARRAGWQFVSLGPRILRIETAAITLVAHLGVDPFCELRGPKQLVPE